MRRRFELMAAEHTARIGERIAQRRNEIGLSQRALADLLPGKTDGNQVSKWERGQHQPSPDTLEHIAKVLQVEVAHFLIPEPTSNSADLLSVLGRGGAQSDLTEALFHIATGLAADARTPSGKAAFARAAELLSPPSAGRRRRAS